MADRLWFQTHHKHVAHSVSDVCLKSHKNHRSHPCGRESRQCVYAVFSVFSDTAASWRYHWLILQHFLLLWLLLVAVSFKKGNISNKTLLPLLLVIFLKGGHQRCMSSCKLQFPEWLNEQMKWILLKNIGIFSVVTFGQSHWNWTINSNSLHLFCIRSLVIFFQFQ